MAKLTYDIRSYNKNFDRISVVLQPAGERLDRCPHVYTFGHVGPGIPMSVYHSREMNLLTGIPWNVVADSLVKWIEEHTDQIVAISAGYEGRHWDGHNMVGSWSEDANEAAWLLDEELQQDLAHNVIATYWEAYEYFYPASKDVLDAALKDGDIAMAAEREAKDAQGEGCYIDTSDAVDTIRALAEHEIESLNGAIAEERLRRMQLRKLL